MDVIIESTTITGKTYKVDTVALTCDCPDFLYRKSKVGALCKHIEEALRQLEEKSKSEDDISVQTKLCK
jgi:hypothetical protein